MSEEFLRHLFDREFDTKEILQKEKRARNGPQAEKGADIAYADLDARIELYGKELSFIKSTISLYIKLHSK